jgi:hypothetical protein
MADTTAQQSGPTFMDMIQNSADRSTDMMHDFKRLETKFDSMMKINDISKLKAQMQNYEQQMMTMQKEIAHNSQMQQQMLSMMKSGNMPADMMGNRSKANMQGMGMAGQDDEETR